MRSLSLLLSASLLLLAATASAQTLPYPPPDTAPLTAEQVSSRAVPHRIKPQDAREISGDYDMDNGWYLRVKVGPRYIDTIIDDQPPLRLVPITPYTFVSGDRKVTMRFGLGVTGEDMEMEYVPDRRLAQRVVISSRTAQR